MKKTHALASAVVDKLKATGFKWIKVLAMVIVTVTMLLGIPQDAKAANPPKAMQTRIGPYQCVAIPQVTELKVHQLEPSPKEIDYTLFWNGNQKNTYEYCLLDEPGEEYTVGPGEIQTYKPLPYYDGIARVEITNLNKYYQLDYGDVLVVDYVTTFY